MLPLSKAAAMPPHSKSDMKRLAVATLLLLLPLTAHADVVVLRAKRMLDVERGVIVANSVIVVEGETIRSVGVAPPTTAAKIIDLGDVTLLPGLMDMHTHLSIGRAEGYPTGRESSDGPIDQAIRATVNAKATLLAGFTSVREAGATDFIDVSLKKAIAHGTIIGPRITPSGAQISMTGGHGDNVGEPVGHWELTPKQGVADGPDQLLFAVRYQLKHGAEVIKLMATAGVLGFERTATARQFSDEELRTVVEEARRNGVKVMAHAHGREGILAAIRAGVDSIEHGSQLDAEGIRLMKERGTFLVPTIYLAMPEAGTTAHFESEHVKAKGAAMSEAARKAFQAAVAAGVPIAFGTDAGVRALPHGTNARELEAMVRLGMKPADAIRSATVVAAKLLGVDDRGVIAAGKLADIIAVAGDPLQDVRTLERVVFVMKNGQIYKGGM